MTIIIKLSTGKEIELTEDEYRELRGTAPPPVYPWYPSNPWTTPSYPNQPYYYTVTCSSSNLPPKE